MREFRKKIIIACVIVNIATNIPLNIILPLIGIDVVSVVEGELLVVIIEAFAYYFVVKEIKRSVVYSILCNTASFLVGILVNKLIY